MKRLPQSLQDNLLRYIDGGMDVDEQKSFESQLAQNEVLRQQLEQQRLIHQALRNTVDQPSRNFTQVVMGKLDQYPAQSPGISIRNGIFLLVGVLAAVGIAIMLVAAGVFDSASATVSLNEFNLAQRLIKQPLPVVSVNGKLVVNIIILLNLGLAWIVLDRAILKPLFQRRMNAE